MLFEDLEKELAPFLGKASRQRIKDQIKEAKSFADDLQVSGKQISKSIMANLSEKSSREGINFWENIKKDFGCVQGISVPVFSKDYKYAFVYEYLIYGRLAGGGSCRVYKRGRDGWKLVKTFNEWVS